MKKLTNIKWTKIGELYWSDNLGEMDWYEAQKKCKELGGCLPTRIELMNLVDNHIEEIKDWEDYIYSFWSSSEKSWDSAAAWRVYLSNGHTYFGTKASPSNVRCVRR